MAESSNKQETVLMHFHVCVYCGTQFSREDFEGRALTSGIFLCPKCDTEGPLNVEIRPSRGDDISNG